MTEIEIQEAIAGLENDHIELKADLSATEAQEHKLHVMRSLTAFYNTKGGTILFGIRDKTGEVVGVPNPQQLEHSFFQQLRGNVPDLDVSPSVEITEFKGQKIVIVRCPKGPRPPYKIRGYERPFVRIGSSNIEASDDQIAQMCRDRSPDPQDRMLLEAASVEDLDLNAAEGYLKKTSFNEFSTKDLMTLLSREGFVSKRTDGNFVPTIAGILLFGKNPQNFLPHAVIKADVKMNEEQNDWDDLQTFGGTLFDQLRAVEAFIRRHIPVAARIAGFRRINTPVIPLEALREAVVNAVVHRDYRDSLAETHLRVRGTSVSILNPGGFIPPLTIEIVIRGDFAPRSRNATIAEALVRMGGFMEKRGSGIERMRRVMRDVRLPEPEFLEEAGAFRVLFRATLVPEKIKTEPKPFINENELTKLGLEEAHYNILELIEEKGEVRPSEVEKLLGRSRPFTNARLEELIGKEVLVRTTEKKQDPNVAFKLHPRFLSEEAKKSGLLQGKLL
jgi:ATP-dependent DNA helicase RecG